MLDFKKCGPQYWDDVFNIRNQPSNIDKFGTRIENITSHYHYMSTNWDKYYVCLKDEKVVGFIGIPGSDLRICVDELHKRQGIGKFMIKKLHENSTHFMLKYHVKVKIDNIESLKFFESLGMTKKFYIMEHECSL